MEETDKARASGSTQEEPVITCGSALLCPAAGDPRMFWRRLHSDASLLPMTAGTQANIWQREREKVAASHSESGWVEIRGF